MATKTLDFEMLGKAKKQRNVLRDKIRQDIQKFCIKFPGTGQFEVAHAIMDSVLQSINESETNYGKPGMPNGLAQTLLPCTEALIGKTPEADQTSLFASDQIHPAKKGPITNPKDWIQWSDLPSPAKKGSFTLSGPKKLDKDVTLADTTSTTLCHVASSWHEHLAAKGKVKDLENILLCTGKVWLSASNKHNKLGKSGPHYTLWRMQKDSPYISATDLAAYKISPPAGYKWRKLKNKPIYKAIVDPKSPTNWTKAKESLAQVAKEFQIWDQATLDDQTNDQPMVPGVAPKLYTQHIATGELMIIYGYLEYPGSLAKECSPPSGWVWEKNPVNDSAKLVQTSL